MELAIEERKQTSVNELNDLCHGCCMFYIIILYFLIIIEGERLLNGQLSKQCVNAYILSSENCVCVCL